MHSFHCTIWWPHSSTPIYSSLSLTLFLCLYVFLCHFLSCSLSRSIQRPVKSALWDEPVTVSNVRVTWTFFSGTCLLLLFQQYSGDCLARCWRITFWEQTETSLGWLVRFAIKTCTTRQHNKLFISACSATTDATGFSDSIWRQPWHNNSDQWPLFSMWLQETQHVSSELLLD